MVLLAFRVPLSWREALMDAARNQGISMADLARMIFRAFLRGRLDSDQRAALEARP